MYTNTKITTLISVHKCNDDNPISVHKYKDNDPNIYTNIRIRTIISVHKYKDKIPNIPTQIYG